MIDAHTVPLPGTDWAVWKDALVRSAGFPADGLDMFAAPGCAKIADAHLDARATAEELRAALGDALDEASRTVAAIAADPLFREAVTWQNPAFAAVLRRMSTGPPAPGVALDKKERKSRRSRENTVVRYWQRYCGKNDTIGFFGPVAWATLDPGAPAVRVRQGDGLVRAREVGYEFWALLRYAEVLAADPLVAPWLLVGVHPHLALDLTTTDSAHGGAAGAEVGAHPHPARDRSATGGAHGGAAGAAAGGAGAGPGGRVLRPDGPPIPLDQDEAALLRRCDGETPAAVAARDPGEALLLGELIDRGIVRHGVDMPYNSAAEGVLRATLAGIPDPAVRDRALAGLRRLDACRAEVAASAGSPERLADALTRLDATFTDVTGTDAEHRQGQMYAGRRVCFEDTTRDVELTFGGPILEALAAPFGRVLLPAARWLSAELAGTYATAFRDLFDELRRGAPEIPLGAFWEPALRLITGSPRPADTVIEEFTRRWIALFGLGTPASRDGGPGARIDLRSADLAEQVARLFAAPRPGWAAARVHSPDLHVSAASVEALERGDFTLVLGEMHTAWPTLDNSLFTDRHPEPARLRGAAATDIGPQFRPLYPTWWPRYTARIAPNLGVTDHQLAFAPAPGADPDRVLPVGALTVVDRAESPMVVAPDGRGWPLFDVFALLVGWLGTEAFKLTGELPHTPRVTLDRLVVARETWRTTIGGTGMARTAGSAPEYLAARRLRRDLGLPERVFVKIGTEVKPVYVDFTGPRYVSMLATMLRSARDGHGDGVPVVITELLPAPEEAWLPDAQGRRYHSELRIQIRDPVRA
ncbi:MAG: lantibiotic dehydratase [Streptosporangiales bacterium]|nr:lantibiotic dehydratase [Streptosporangiales bacterium]